MKKIIISVILICLLINTISVVIGESYNYEKYENSLPLFQKKFSKNKNFNNNYRDYHEINTISNSTCDMGGSIIWEYSNDIFDNSCVTISDYGANTFIGQVGSSNVCFQLFDTLGNGTPKWEYAVTNESHWAQVDSSEEGGILVGLASNDISIPNKFTRLYKWNSTDNVPDWYFDIPNDLEVFRGGFIQDNIGVSDNGEKIVLAACNYFQQLIKIFVFNPDSAVPILVFPIYFSWKAVGVNLLEVSYDGSFVFVACDMGAVIIDTNSQEIRWSSEHNIATISEDASIVVYQNWDNGHTLTLLEWNEVENEYIELWTNHITPVGWFICVNTHTLEISDDGSRILTGVSSSDDLKTKLIMTDACNGDFLWEHNTTAYGQYLCIIWEIRLSNNGNIGIVGYSDDEFNMNPELKIFDRNSSIPIFYIDSPGAVESVDISPDGKLAICGGELYPSGYADFGIIDYSIDLGYQNKKPDKPYITGPNSGKAGISYWYNISTTDPDYDNLFYFIEWGDNTNSSWFGSYNSSEIITVSHVWFKRGRYTIKTKAKDVYGAESDWTTFEVSMPRNKTIFKIHSIFLWLLERVPILEYFFKL